MRILIAHNAYQHRGGEDSVVDSEMSLLRGHGHEVESYGRHNDEIHDMGRLQMAGQTLWSARTVRDMEHGIAAFKPDIIHVHNTFPLISPSLYWAAGKMTVPVVQTLHNFRLLCPQAMLLREGKVCEDCVGRSPWRGVGRACYRGSVAQTGALAGMLALHRALGTYRRKVTRYIALNDFCREVFVRGGLPAERLRVKPNFVDMPPAPAHEPRGGALFVGRLSPEKGIASLADAARALPDLEISLIGTGPEEQRLEGIPNLRRLGFRDGAAVRAAMCRASWLAMPSIWYENFPRTLVEAFACGLPVIASRLGAMAELVEDGRTGLLFEAGNATDLAEKMKWARNNPDAMRRMGENARAEYEAKYTPEINYRQLMAIYADAMEAGHG